MRIRTLTVNGFRAWPGKATVDLDGDAVIVVAANGQGKTSLFDAVMWSLTGSIPRLGGDEFIISKYSETGQAFVSIDLCAQNEDFRVTRFYDGTAQSVQFERGGKTIGGASAQSDLIELLWPAALSAPEPSEALTAAFTRCIYLQQDLVRDFVQSDDDQERFNAVSEIIGTGRVTELQIQLERAKTAWTKATNERFQDSTDVRRRATYIQEQLSSFQERSINLGVVDKIWKTWWEMAEPLLEKRPGLSAASSRAASSLDTALKELTSKLLAYGRDVDALTELHVLLKQKPNMGAADHESTIAAQLKATLDRVKVLEDSIEESRRRQKAVAALHAERAESKSEVVQLARLALKHLADHCPICEQSYDVSRTRKRLEDVVKKAGLHEDSALTAAFLSAEALESELVEMNRRAKELRDQLGQVRETADRSRAWRSDIARRASLQNLPADNFEAALEERLSSSKKLVLAAEELRASGETLAAQLGAASEAQRRTELLNELEVLKGQVSESERDYKERTETGDAAQHILNVLRDSAFDLVQDQITEIEPLLQRIYATADPHPAFTDVQIISSQQRGRGRLLTEITDPKVKKVHSRSPASILSSSQLNVLAVSMFLALNLAVKDLPLSCAILDDPLQSLDDLNLLGLVDVLRYVKDRRQLFISTHDSRFGALLKRKLRANGTAQRTRVLEFAGWSRQGPTISEHDALYEASKEIASA